MNSMIKTDGEKKIIGIIGGMGPGATVLLFQKLVDLTDAHCDRDHIHILIDNYPQIPDRTKAILAGSDEPVSYICASAKKLIAMGAELLLLPCNTSHFFFHEIQKNISVPLVNMVEETADCCRQAGYQKVAVLATAGTCQTDLYKKALAARGIDTIYPTPAGQEEVTRVIYDQVKAGQPIDTTALKKHLDQMRTEGAEAFVLGCTELPIALRAHSYGYPYVDALDVLARSAIRYAGYQVRSDASCVLLR